MSKRDFVFPLVKPVVDKPDQKKDAEAFFETSLEIRGPTQKLVFIAHPKELGEIRREIKRD
ncbi:MAG: hypothetical protein AAF585_27520 [Verrucomicrobiota bacterium]